MSDSTGAMFCHDPLPYVVTVKVVESDDAVPTERVERVVAYSILEAMIQATTNAGGSRYDDSRYSVTRIEPDVTAFMRMKADEIAKALVESRRRA